MFVSRSKIKQLKCRQEILDCKTRGSGNHDNLRFRDAKKFYRHLVVCEICHRIISGSDCRCHRFGELRRRRGR